MKVIVLWKDDKRMEVEIAEKERAAYPTYFEMCMKEWHADYLRVPTEDYVTFLDLRDCRAVSLVLREVKQSEEVPDAK